MSSSEASGMRARACFEAPPSAVRGRTTRAASRLLASRDPARQARHRDVRFVMRWASLASAVVLAGGCYHYTFEQRQPAPGGALIRPEQRVPTWLNGLVGTGRIDTTQYCAQPVRTELQVRATDVLLSLVTLLINTP